MASRMQMVEGLDPTNSVGRRAVAAVFDQILIWFTSIAVFALSDVRLVQREEIGAGGSAVSYTYEGPTWQIVLVGGMWLIYWVGVFVVLQGRTGWTPGKFFLSLRCVKWDGRPPGMAKALVRTIPYFVAATVFGWLGLAISFVTIVFTRGHRRLGDMLAATYVVGTTYEGRIISMTSKGASAGPPSVYADEVGAAVPAGGGGWSPAPSSGAGTWGAPAGPAPTGLAAAAARRRPSRPEYDKALDAYVVWDNRTESLLVLDKKTGQWHPHR